MENVETSSSHNEDAQTEVLTAKSASGSAFLDEQYNVVRNSLLAGSVAGVTSTIVVHPFDVLRVEMQSSAPATMASPLTTNTRTVGLVGTLRSTLHYGGGLRALYTGLAMPLAAQAIYKGTVFTVNNMTESYILDWKTRKNNSELFEAPCKLTLNDRFISGFMGGAVNAALFCTPVEYVRNQQIAQIKNNMNPSNSITKNVNKIKSVGDIFRSRNNNGPIAVIRRTIQGNGLGGLWRGMASTVLRDSVGCGFFFAAMAYSQEKLAPDHSNRPPQTAVLILSGALAGVSFWLWALPIDTMKTWIQNGTARNLSDAVRISQRNGLAQSIPSLFRGWQVAYSRGAPSAAITVLTYSLAFQYLQGTP